MAVDPAELAFGHALAMLGDPGSASDVAMTALRRAGRARGLVLAHAREQAVARAAEDPPVDIAATPTVVLDLPALAATLASTRPPQERAALDVRARTGGDLVALGQALGVRPSVAADRCNEIAEEWERTLDPALLAFSGAGDCDALGAILTTADPHTVADLLDVAPAVHAHAQGCTLCSDRMRAMASVRSFFSSGQVDVPSDVRHVGHVSRRRRPSAAPVPLFAVAATKPPHRFTRRSRAVIGVAATVLAVVGTMVVLQDEDSRAVNRLTQVSGGGALVIETPEVTGDLARVTLRNLSERAVSYRAAASAQWASVSPGEGRIPANGAALLLVRATADAPEGEVRATLTVTTSGGGAMSEELAWRLERAPDLDATANGCAVDVHVVEEGELASLVLHWRDAGEHSVQITNGPEGYRTQLRPEGQPITYWVTASDGRGNQSRTADQVIPVGAC